MAGDIDLAAADRLLTTTRAVRRRLDLDRPVERDVLLECIAIAQQAPTGGNSQRWAFVLVTDEAKRARIAELYREASEDQFRRAAERARSLGSEQTARAYEGAQYLAGVLDRVPVHVIPCFRGRLAGAGPLEPAAAGLYGSIIPAAWSFALALRARGLGTVWTTMHLHREREVAELLGLPDDVTQVALLPVAYYTGDTFSPAERPAPQTVTHWDRWDTA